MSARRCSLCVPLLSPSVRLPHLCGYLCAAVSWQPPATTVQLPLHNYLCGAIHRQLRLIAGCLPSPNAAVLGSCTQCTQHKSCLTQTSAHVPHTKQQPWLRCWWRWLQSARVCNTIADLFQWKSALMWMAPLQLCRGGWIEFICAYAQTGG